MQAVDDFIDFSAIAKLNGRELIEQAIKQLISQVSYLNQSEQQQLIESCFFGAQAHKAQYRASGEPYICHPIKVAGILATEVQFELSVLQAAILHDVIEDTAYSKKEIEGIFSKEVANLVDGVSKLEKDQSVSPEELQARTFEKLAFAMKSDPRVVMIKLADRMHNMQTLGSLRAEKRQRIAKETLDVYVPIAKRLGMYGFKVALEELAFKQLYPWRYKVIKKLLTENERRQKLHKEIVSTLSKALEKEGIQATIRKRRRSLYDIFKKIQKYHLSRRQIEYASLPFLIITQNEEDCYRVLWKIHHHYTPISKTIEDYISSPKSNGYQALHSSGLTSEKIIANFQIKTQEMHAIAQSGIIAILKYQNVANSIKGPSKHAYYDISIRRWLNNIENLSHLTVNPIEYYNSVKQDLTDFDIQVLTPKGEPVALPEGSTVVDFAYQIHRSIGNKMTYAEVNGVRVDLDYQLSNGQTIEVFTQENAIPKCSWLFSVKTARAKTAIKHYIRSLPPKEIEAMGLSCLTRFLESKKLEFHRRLRDYLVSVAKEKYHCSYSALLRKIALFEIDFQALFEEIKHYDSQTGVNCNLEVCVLNTPGALASISKYLSDKQVNILRVDFLSDHSLNEIIIRFKLHSESLKVLRESIKRMANSQWFVKINKEDYTL